MPTGPSTSPRTGILLNTSPGSSAPSSPKRNSYLSPCSSDRGVPVTHQITISSHSSTSSTASSTDDIASSTSATSATGTHVSSPSVAPLSARKIRFAPLPERRRDEYEDDLLSPGFFDSSPMPSPKPVPSQGGHFLSPPPSPRLAPSPNLPASHGQASCSTLGLGLDGVELPGSGQATETNTVAGSECGTDDTHTLANARKKSARWSRLIPFPKASSFRPRTADEQHHLCRSPSRESTASAYSFRSVSFGRIFGTMSDSNCSSSSLGNPLSRRKTVSGADSMPVSPTISLQSGLSLKPVASEFGTASSPTPRGKTHASTRSGPPTVRRGTRLLNGRIYGRRPSTAPPNYFANIRDEEPEFVEWGHGGMGSVRNKGLGSTQWARLQSDKKLSIGHDDGTVAEDEDDGSGMNWVKKRREQREREKKEREEREAKEKVEDGDSREKVEKASDAVAKGGEVTPQPEAAVESENAASKEEAEKP